MSLYSTLMYSSARFQAFAATHLAALGLSVALAFLLVALGRLGRLHGIGRHLQIALGLTIFVLETVFILYPVPLGSFSVRYSLPLQLCDLTAYAAALSLLFRWQLATEVAFYLGCTTTLVTSISPDLARDFPHIEFICFFASHSLVSAAMIFTVFGLRERIRDGAVIRVLGVVHCLAVPIGLVNHFLGSNYFYICRKPGVSTMMDWLGPWPYYVIAIDVLLVCCLMLLDAVVKLIQESPPTGPVVIGDLSTG